jgi:hypothetical protein
VPRHNPFVYFDDVTGTNDVNYAYGIAHIRPFSELASDLTNNNVARYNFITPNLCNDMHDSCAPLYDPIRQGDTWLASEIPRLMASAAYTNNGAIFIVWDEGDPDDGPIGCLLLSPVGRGGGYFNRISYTHSSMLRTVEEMFAVTPLLGDAAVAADLSDLFCRFGFSHIQRFANGVVQLTASGVIPGRTNLVTWSSNLTQWFTLSTNSVSSNSFSVLDGRATNASVRFYRLVQK